MAASAASIKLTDKELYTLGSYLGYVTPWGKGSLVEGIDYFESMTLTSNLFPNSANISWDWPVQTVASIKSFLAIDYGDYSYTRVASPITSSQIASISKLSATTNFTMSGQSSGFDMIYDMFLTSKAGSASTHLNELEVFLHTPSYTQGWVQSLKQIGSFTSGGITWNVATTTGSTPDILITPSGNQDLTASMIDIKAMFNFLVSKGVLSGSEYFNGMAMGVETASGIGSVDISNFAVQYDVTKASAPTITGTVAGQTTSGAAVKLFGSTTLIDANSGATDTLTITIKGAGGVLKDGSGFTGLQSKGNGVYTLSGSAAAISAELHSLIFTPATEAAGTTSTSSLTLSDSSSAGTTVSNSTTTVIEHVAGLAAPTISVVRQTSGTTSVVSSAPGSVVGAQPASASVTLTGTAVGATSVVLMDGTTKLASAAPNSATGAYSFAGLFSLGMGEHSLTAIASDAAGDVSAASAPLVVEVGTAATIVSELNYLQTKAGLGAIELTDTHVLNVASIAAMKTLISTDANALSHIDGGYTFVVSTAQSNGSTLVSTFSSSGILTKGEIDFSNRTSIVYDYGITNQAYTSDRKLYSATGQVTEVDTYNASMQELSSVQYVTGATISAKYTNGAMTHSEIDYINGTKVVMDSGITGKSYTSDRYAYNAAGVNTEYDTYTASGAQTAYMLGSNLTLTAGSAAETFVVGSNFGKSTVQNFQAPIDRISLSTADFADFATVLHDATQTSSGAVQLTAANGDRLTINNMTLASLSANKSDFTFHS